jgi:hypothetical protein
MIGFIDTLFTQYSELQALPRYRYSKHFQFTVTPILGFSVFTSRILATELQQFHCHFKSHMECSCHSLIPFLPFLLNHLRLPSSELDPVPNPSRLLHFTTTVLYFYNSASTAPVLPSTSYNHFAQTPRKTRSSTSRMHVY